MKRDKEIIKFPKVQFAIFTVLLIFLLSDLSACGGTVPESEPISKTAFLLDTMCSVTVYTKDDARYAEEALALCAEYEQLLSRTVADSDISRINAANGRAVAVSQATIELLNKAVYYGELSDGGFDVSIGAVSSLWDFSSASAERSIPDEGEIAAKLTSVNFKDIEVTENTIRLTRPGAQLDLGGIAKGYIADRLAAFLTESGVKTALIDLGGNVVTVGEKADGTPWKVGVRNPFTFGAPVGENSEGRENAEDPVSTILGTITVSGTKSIGTSGTYERYFMQNGVRYHHILDPVTGFPAETDLAGVTVVTDLSVDGEGFTTTCILLGSVAAQQFLEENHIQAVLLKEDGTVITTGDIDYVTAR
ncbi:MAG: FAD:protein FMN transferase [Clostridiales Family XIII bacterium]|nr:FAD:protein FMN transferase [Clostridiales Family XIII bacterium]